MSMPPDLEAYFQRIGYEGDASPTLATLHEIHRLHPERIPFENLDPLLGLRVRLDLASLQDKLISRRRGGYCFEHNLLLRYVLEAMGFRVNGLAARVRWNVPEGASLPLTHMLLRIELEAHTWIADVGFGGQVLTAPLLLEPGLVQQTPHEPYRLTTEGDGYVLECQLGERWLPLYHFDLREQLLPDYEMGNWYVSTHPESRFTTNLIIARTEAGRRYTLHNGSFAVHNLREGTQRTSLSSTDQMKELLRDCFRIQLPEHPNLEKVLAHFLSTTP